MLFVSIRHRHASESGWKHHLRLSACVSAASFVRWFSAQAAVSPNELPIVRNSFKRKIEIKETSVRILQVRSGRGGERRVSDNARRRRFLSLGFYSGVLLEFGVRNCSSTTLYKTVPVSHTVQCTLNTVHSWPSGAALRLRLCECIR